MVSCLSPGGFHGAPLPAVMRLGGWRKLETVQRYTHFSDATAVAVHRATSPVVTVKPTQGRKRLR